MKYTVEQNKTDNALIEFIDNEHHRVLGSVWATRNAIRLMPNLKQICDKLNEQHERIEKLEAIVKEMGEEAIQPIENSLDICCIYCCNSVMDGHYKPEEYENFVHDDDCPVKRAKELGVWDE